MQSVNIRKKTSTTHKEVLVDVPKDAKRRDQTSLRCGRKKQKKGTQPRTPKVLPCG